MSKNTTKSEAARKAAFKKHIDTSNARIAAALEVMERTNRGEAVLKQLDALFSGPATGLDTQGMNALFVLVDEFANNHRRGFIPRA